MCDGKRHNLEIIYAHDFAFATSNVVRWCRSCGAVVVDIDCDCRTQPGAVMRMKFPEITLEAAKKS